MDDALLVRVLHRVGDLGQDLQTVLRGQVVERRVLQDRPAADQLHREVGLRPGAGLEGARLVDLRDARVLQAPQHVRFVLEAREHLGRRHAGVDHLERHRAARAVLLGLVDDAHAALAELGEDPVLPDAVGDHLAGNGLSLTGRHADGLADRRPIEAAHGPLVLGEQGQHLVLQLFVIAALLVEKARAVRLRQPQGGPEELVHLVKPVRLAHVPSSPIWR